MKTASVIVPLLASLVMAAVVRPRTFPHTIQDHQPVHAAHASARALGSGSVPLVTRFDDVGFMKDSSISDRHLHKRDYYTCFNTETTNVTLPDCQKVITNIRHYNGSLTVLTDLCLTWYSGSCKAALCAGDAAIVGLNVTSAWVADRLATPLLDHCVAKGKDAVTADCDDIDGDCGKWRLYLAHSQWNPGWPI